MKPAQLVYFRVCALLLTLLFSVAGARAVFVSIMLVLISPEGTAQQIRPQKMLGYGLDEQAYAAIKKWKFRPAHNSDGTFVATIVPVEVSFRLY